MRITIVTPGRFHLADLGRELISAGHDVTFISSLPRWHITKFGIPRKQIVGLWIHEVIWRFVRRFLPSLVAGGRLQFVFHRLYAMHAGAYVKKSDFYIVGSAFLMPIIEKLRKKGGQVILERGSTHIIFQTEILSTEYSHYGLTFEETSKRIIAQEVLEYKLCDYINVPTQFCKSTYVDQGVSEGKILVHPYGVNTSFFSKSLKRRHPSEPFRLLHVGTLSIRKGIIRLLDAVDTLPNVEIACVGAIDPSISNFLVRFRGSKKIQIVGPVPQNELPIFYSEAHAFILASIEEGLAVVTLQALASGLPIICSSATGVGEYVKNGVHGILIDDIPTQLLEAIKSIRDNIDLYHRMARNVFDSSFEFSWRAYGCRVDQTLQTLNT